MSLLREFSPTICSEVVLCSEVGFYLSLRLQGRLNELMSQIRMHTQIPGSAGSEGRYAVDPPLMADIQQVRQKLYSEMGM